MTWIVVVVLAVVAANGFLVWQCWRCKQALTQVEVAVARARDWLASESRGGRLDPLVQRLLPSAEELARSCTERERRAVRNQLTLELQGWLERGQLVSKLGWRACAAAGMAGAFALVSSATEAALIVVGVSGTAAAICWRFGRSADSRKAAVRDHWKALMASLVGSFSA